jgi:integrase
VLCLLTGVRSEEARTLTWSHVDLDAKTISVWRSARAHGDTKTNRSRRTLRIPQVAVEALQAQLCRQYEERSKAGETCLTLPLRSSSSTAGRSSVLRPTRLMPA